MPSRVANRDAPHVAEDNADNDRQYYSAKHHGPFASVATALSRVDNEDDDYDHHLRRDDIDIDVSAAKTRASASRRLQPTEVKMKSLYASACIYGV
jgi:hypothetical protein